MSLFTIRLEENNTGTWKKQYHASSTTLATGATLHYICEIIYSRCYDPETYHVSTCFTPEAGGGSDIFH